MASFTIPGDPISYYNRERRKYNEAFGAYGHASPEELALMAEQVKAIKQAQSDREATRGLILAQMGLKLVTDDKGQKTLAPLTKEERLKIMSEADKSRSKASESYRDRAKAAVSGTTKLPSFLKKDIDHQKVKENALLEEMLGPDAVNSTAGKQALEALRKKEESVRQQIQEQDLATAPGKSMDLSGQLEASRGQKIGSYEALPNLNTNLVQGRGALLQQMQQQRLDALKKRYAELEAKRQQITGYLTLGGTVGGAAISQANQRKTEPNVTNTGANYSGYGGTTYNNSYLGNSTSGMGTSYDNEWLYK